MEGRPDEEAPSGENLDGQGWRDVVALVIERVDVQGLGEYALTWTEAGRLLRSTVETVQRTSPPRRMRGSMKP